MLQFDFRMLTFLREPGTSPRQDWISLRVPAQYYFMPVHMFSIRHLKKKKIHPHK